MSHYVRVLTRTGEKVHASDDARYVFDTDEVPRVVRATGWTACYRAVTSILHSYETADGEAADCRPVDCQRCRRVIGYGIDLLQRVLDGES